MAPEIFKGPYDERCDIWSLGIILFMLVTGEPPVSGTTSEEILANIREGKLNLKSRFYVILVLATKLLNSSLVDLILKMLVGEDARIGLKDIMVHPWLTMKLSEKKLNINF